MAWGRKVLVVGVALEVAGLVSTGLGSWLAQRAEHLQEAEEFSHAVERGQQAIETRLEKYRQGLVAGAAFLALHEDMPPATWKAYVDGLNLDEEFPGINGFGRIRPAPREDLANFLAREAVDHPALSYHAVPGSVLVPETAMVIDRIEPLDRNRPALGLDIASESRRREAAVAARVSGRPAITRIIQLVQDKTQHPGFLMLVPYYRPGAPLRTPRERGEAFRGWSYAPFVGARTLDGIAAATGEGLCFEVFDEVASPGNRIYGGCDGSERTGTPEVRRMAMAGRTWVVVWTRTTAGSRGTSDPWARWLMVLGAMNFLGILALMWWFHHSAERALREARAAASEKGDFLAVMSHEIRTPLNGILGAIDLLERQPLGEESRRLLGIVRGSGQGLQELVSDILDFAKLENGGIGLESVPFDPGDIVRSCADSLRAAAEARGVAMRVAVGDGVGWRRGDPLRLRQIAMNLLSNASKFTRSGAVTASLSGGTEGIEFEVRDTGIGMDAAALRNLFQPFRQADSSIGRRFGGTGLGLAIVKRIVDRMGGIIQVESVPDQGTVFRLSLPLPVAHAPVERESQVVPADVRGLRVLAVDDNEVNLEVLQGLLVSLGCEVGTASDGATAVAAVGTGVWNVVLMDCRMPGMDGFEATRRLRAGGVKIPIVALTANAFASDREECLRAGMTGFLAKPVRLDALREVLAQAAAAPVP